MYRTFCLLVCVTLLFTFLALLQPAFAQENPLSQDEVQIILIQFKLYETFVQGALQQYITLWASDAEFRASGGVYKGKQEIETFANGLMQGKPQSIQNRLILTIKGETATVSTRTLYGGTPTATLAEMDIVYRYVKEGGQWLIQVEDANIPHVVELPDATFEKEFREVFYPVFQNAIETFNQSQVASFTAEDVKVISTNGQQSEGLLRLMEELQRAPLVFQEDVYVNREESVIAVLKTDSGNALLNFEKQPDGSLILRKADFSFRGFESITGVRLNGKCPIAWGKIKTAF